MHAEAVDAGEIAAETVTLPLAGNPRAKMQGVTDGFVKLFCRPGTGIVVGGVVVAPRASELIHPVALAVAQSLTVDSLAQAFTVYPSMSGSVAEAAAGCTTGRPEASLEVVRERAYCPSDAFRDPHRCPDHRRPGRDARPASRRPPPRRAVSVPRSP